MSAATDAAPQPDVTRPAPAQDTEPLACVSCRARKLKCDRTKPACTRCTRVENQCVYPGSRRKPAFKRRNVKELEARLAQVEEFLKEANRGNEDVGAEESILFDEPEISLDTNVSFPADNASQDANASGTSDPPRLSFDMPSFTSPDDTLFSNGGVSGQLMELGLAESLPPLDIMEELNNAFFCTHYHYLPIVHPGRYYQAFYGAAARKPPMCLQYSMWAMAACGHPKYDQFVDIFYKRARQYAEGDEMRSDGEHFITVAHAQSWTILASYEARNLLFTRASMSTARCTRLVQMMGLDRLDRESGDIPPTLGPPTSWTELEERRRVFWGAFAVDAHACVATGWANLINSDQIMTRLPASEAAFEAGQEEQAPFLDDVFNRGASFDGFSGAIVIAQVFKTLMGHIHGVKPSDQPQDLIHGAFWKRHRDLDNRLLGLFMFLPEKLRLPQNIRDPSAVHTNLNLHAAVICLHHAALEMIEKHGLPDSTKKNSQCRLKASAEEIANIIKLTSHHTTVFRSQMCAHSLYCATTVYVYLAKDDPVNGISPLDSSNLEIIISAMEAIGRVHRITCAFLQQACLDIERNGLSSCIRLPALSQYRDVFGGPASSIPMIARSPISKHTEMSSPLPGRLPLDMPKGIARPKDLKLTKPMPSLRSVNPADGFMRRSNVECFRAVLGPVTRNVAPRDTAADVSHKRKRQSPSPGPASLWTAASAEDSSSDFWKQGMSRTHLETRGELFNGFFALPDRTTSTASSPGNRGTDTGTLPHSSNDTSPGQGLGNTPGENRIDLRQFQGRVSAPLWQTTEEGVFAQMTEAIGNISGDGDDPWTFLDGSVGWDNGNGSSG